MADSKKLKVHDMAQKMTKLHVRDDNMKKLKINDAKGGMKFSHEITRDKDGAHKKLKAHSVTNPSHDSYGYK